MISELIDNNKRIGRVFFFVCFLSYFKKIISKFYHTLQQQQNKIKKELVQLFKRVKSRQPSLSLSLSVHPPTPSNIYIHLSLFYIIKFQLVVLSLSGPKQPSRGTRGVGQHFKTGETKILPYIGLGTGVE